MVVIQTEKSGEERFNKLTGLVVERRTNIEEKNGEKYEKLKEINL